MASLGQDLKRERETRGISLRDISDSTRIGLRYLEALEADRFELIPQKFFIRAIIRSYAKSVGLEEARWLERFDEMSRFGEQLEYKASRAEASPGPFRRPGRRPALLLTLGAAAAAALLYVFVLAPRRGGRSPDQARPAAAAPAVVPAPDPAPPVSQAPEPPSQEPPAPAFTGLNLQATFAEDTWLRVIADGRQVYEGIKRPGETLEAAAERELVLATGNAGGMDFSLNGRRARPLGPRGAVMTDIRLTPANFAAYLAPGPPD